MRVIAALVSVTGLLGLIPAADVAAASPTPAAYCTPIDRTIFPASDYRLRNTTQELRYIAADNYKVHTAPALERLRKGELRYVLQDLNFVLRNWPNDLVALEALVRYDLAGGERWGFMPTECYFLEARRLYPEDPNVPALEGVFFARKGDSRRAMKSYQDALVLNPSMPEVHYNLGLLYFEKKDFANSLKHARLAYEGGYQLPGLRKKLERAGYWQ